jgi:hypothetical protein
MENTILSLQEQLAQAEERLRLVQERKDEYVEPTSIPLDLIRTERHWKKRIADLQARLAQLTEVPCPYRGLEPFEAEPCEDAGSRALDVLSYQILDYLGKMIYDDATSYHIHLVIGRPKRVIELRLGDLQGLGLVDATSGDMPFARFSITEKGLRLLIEKGLVR